MKKRGRNRFTAIVLAMVMMFCLTPAAFADDSTDTVATGVWNQGRFSDDLTKESFTYHFILPESGKVTYKIKTETADAISFTASGGAKGDVVQGETITAEAELRAGEYWIKISEDTEVSSGDFSFYVGFTASNETYQEDHDTIAEALAMAPLPFGEKVTGHFATTEISEVYKIKVKKSGRFYVVVGSVQKAQFWLLDPDNKQLAATAYNSAVGDSKTILKTDLVPGTYYLQINTMQTGGRNSGYYNGVYTFTPKFKASGETYTYENNSIASVKGKTALTLCKTVKGQLALNDSDDYFKIFIPKAGNYNLTVSADKSYYSYGFPLESLQDKTGAAQSYSYYNMDKSNPPVRTYYYKGLARGTYYIHFMKQNATGPYSFIMRPASVNNYKPAAGSRRLTAKWEKGTGTGYQAQIALNKTFTSGKKTATITKASTLKKTFTSLKANKRYYVRVRSYVKYNEKAYYSVWSNKTYITTKS